MALAAGPLLVLLFVVWLKSLLFLSLPRAGDQLLERERDRDLPLLLAVAAGANVVVFCVEETAVEDAACGALLPCC